MAGNIVVRYICDGEASLKSTFSQCFGFGLELGSRFNGSADSRSMKAKTTQKKLKDRNFMFKRAELFLWRVGVSPGALKSCMEAMKKSSAF